MGSLFYFLLLGFKFCSFYFGTLESRGLFLYVFFLCPPQKLRPLESRGWSFLFVSASTPEPRSPEVVPCSFCFLLSTSEPQSLEVCFVCLPQNPRVPRYVLFINPGTPKPRTPEVDCLLACLCAPQIPRVPR